MGHAKIKVMEEVEKEVTKCDRCGKTDIDKPNPFLGNSLHLSGTLKAQHCGGRVTYDFCASCVREFYQFLETENRRSRK